MAISPDQTSEPTVPTVVRMVQRVTDPSRYRQVGPAQCSHRLAAGSIVLEGVDGDQDANTVTYWYRLAVPGEDV